MRYLNADEIIFNAPDGQTVKIKETLDLVG